MYERFIAELKLLSITEKAHNCHILHNKRKYHRQWCHLNLNRVLARGQHTFTHSPYLNPNMVRQVHLTTNQSDMISADPNTI